MQLFHSENPHHTETAELLPWFATGTLEPIEQAKVEQHLMECIACRKDLRDVQAMMLNITDTDNPDPATGFGFSRLKARIEKIETGRRQGISVRTLTTQWLASSPWIRGALLAQTALLLVLSSYLFLANPTPQYYHTLGATPALANTRTKMVVVFNSASAERKIRDVLIRVDARIVDGPTPEGAYTLEVAQDRQRETLEELQRQGIVTLAAPEAPR